MHVQYSHTQLHTSINKTTMKEFHLLHLLAKHYQIINHIKFFTRTGANDQQ